ncbi:hypothetical protein C2W64_01581 [Brevibacillus laterosporus]|nr:hypothetical protein [Brevibacillus laterosporus]RAP30389.1 hypothetical protein C2W64_01581 [Brevibacillus laterosporus]
MESFLFWLMVITVFQLLQFGAKRQKNKSFLYISFETITLAIALWGIGKLIS